MSSTELERQSFFFSQHVAQRAAIEMLQGQTGELVGPSLRESKIGGLDGVSVAQQ